MYSKSLQNKFLILVAVSVHLRFGRSRDQNRSGGSVGTVESDSIHCQLTDKDETKLEFQI